MVAAREKGDGMVDWRPAKLRPWLDEDGSWLLSFPTSFAAAPFARSLRAGHGCHATGFLDRPHAACPERLRQDARCRNWRLRDPRPGKDAGGQPRVSEGRGDAGRRTSG